MRIDYGNSGSPSLLRVLKALALVVGLGLMVSTIVKAAGETTDSAAPEAEASPAPKKKYQRSKLTSDESEATADKRRMLLTTGEDKAVDIDFDPASSGA